MQREEYSYSESRVKDIAENNKDSVKRSETTVIWFVVAMLLVSIIAIGAVVYTTSETVNRGNCTSVGGVMVKNENIWECVDPTYWKERR